MYVTTNSAPSGQGLCGYRGLGDPQYGYGNLSPVPGSGCADTVSPPMMAAYLSAIGTIGSAAQYLIDNKFADVQVRPMIFDPAGQEQTIAQYFKDPNTGELLDAASLIMRSVAAFANGQCYQWRQSSPVVIIATSQSPSEVKAMLSSGQFGNEPNTVYYSYQDPQAAAIMAKIRQPLPGSAFWLSPTPLASTDFVDQNNRMLYGGVNGFGPTLRALAAKNTAFGSGTAAAPPTSSYQYRQSISSGAENLRLQSYANAAKLIAQYAANACGAPQPDGSSLSTGCQWFLPPSAMSGLSQSDLYAANVAQALALQGKLQGQIDNSSQSAMVASLIAAGRAALGTSAASTSTIGPPPILQPLQQAPTMVTAQYVSSDPSAITKQSLQPSANITGPGSIAASQASSAGGTPASTATPAAQYAAAGTTPPAPIQNPNLQPGSQTVVVSSAPSVNPLDGITSWITANPLIAAGLAVGAFFMFSQGGRKG